MMGMFPLLNVSLMNFVNHEMKTLIIGIVLLAATWASALDRIEVHKEGNVSMSGQMSGATDLQFGVNVRGTLDQKIDQLERESRLLRFTRDSFPALSTQISYSGTNMAIAQCIADLSEKVGKPIPMEVGTNKFVAKEFVFEEIPLVDALKYLVALGDAVLDVDGTNLVCRPVRQALALNEPEYDLLHLMVMQRFDVAEKILAQKEVNVQGIKDQDGHNLLHLAAR